MSYTEEVCYGTHQVGAPEGLTSLRGRWTGPLSISLSAALGHGRRGVIEPAIEMAETNDSVITVKVQVPGVSKENLHLDIMDDCLTLKGETKDEETTEGKRFHRRSCATGPSTPIPLPTTVGKRIRR